jgi:hypothetical protein
MENYINIRGSVVVFINNHESFRAFKSAPTELRLPTSAEIGTPLHTWVSAKDDSNPDLAKLETGNNTIISIDHLIAKNPGSLKNLDGDTVFNLYLPSKEFIEKNYMGNNIVSQFSDSYFKPFTKSPDTKSQINILEITPEILDDLSVFLKLVTNDDGTRHAILPTKWGEMVFGAGDFLASTNSGDAVYSIEKSQFENTYLKVSSIDLNDKQGLS